MDSTFCESNDQIFNMPLDSNDFTLDEESGDLGSSSIKLLISQLRLTCVELKVAMKLQGTNLLLHIDQLKKKHEYLQNQVNLLNEYIKENIPVNNESHLQAITTESTQENDTINHCANASTDLVNISSNEYYEKVTPDNSQRNVSPKLLFKNPSEKPSKNINILQNAKVNVDTMKKIVAHMKTLIEAETSKNATKQPCHDTNEQIEVDNSELLEKSNNDSNSNGLSLFNENVLIRNPVSHTKSAELNYSVRVNSSDHLAMPDKLPVERENPNNNTKSYELSPLNVNVKHNISEIANLPSQALPKEMQKIVETKDAANCSNHLEVHDRLSVERVNLSNPQESDVNPREDLSLKMDHLNLKMQYYLNNKELFIQQHLDRTESVKVKLESMSEITSRDIQTLLPIQLETSKIIRLKFDGDISIQTITQIPNNKLEPNVFERFYWINLKMENNKESQCGESSVTNSKLNEELQTNGNSSHVFGDHSENFSLDEMTANSKIVSSQGNHEHFNTKRKKCFFGVNNSKKKSFSNFSSILTSYVNEVSSDNDALDNTDGSAFPVQENLFSLNQHKENQNSVQQTDMNLMNNSKPTALKEQNSEKYISVQNAKRGNATKKKNLQKFPRKNKLKKNTKISRRNDNLQNTKFREANSPQTKTNHGGVSFSNGSTLQMFDSLMQQSSKGDMVNPHPFGQKAFQRTKKIMYHKPNTFFRTQTKQLKTVQNVKLREYVTWDLNDEPEEILQNDRIDDDEVQIIEVVNTPIVID